ncbi:hypothetical protein BZA77DRAFT_308054 [Pyronema omphalodes]|nr:hypothetical protein BZA77DRAFT_308054 [Pyronema omphalodes]
MCEEKTSDMGKTGEEHPASAATVQGEETAPHIPTSKQPPPPTGTTASNTSQHEEALLAVNDINKTQSTAEEKAPNLAKKILTASNRMIYVALSKAVTAKRRSRHSKLLCLLTDLDLPGVERVQNAVHYFLIGCKTTELRDNVIDIIRDTEFIDDDQVIPIVVHPFGDSTFRATTTWSIEALHLSTLEEIRDAIINHLAIYAPELRTPFVWTVLFDTATPIFVREMKMEVCPAFLTPEPQYRCRSCKTAGHNIFQCPTPGERYLHNKAIAGMTGYRQCGDEDNSRDSFVSE